MPVGHMAFQSHLTPKSLKPWLVFCSQIAYRDRLKDIRATLEVSPFFKCHEVDTGLSSPGTESLALWGQPRGLPEAHGPPPPTAPSCSQLLRLLSHTLQGLRAEPLEPLVQPPVTTQDLLKGWPVFRHCPWSRAGTFHLFLLLHLFVCRDSRQRVVDCQHIRWRVCRTLVSVSPGPPAPGASGYRRVRAHAMHAAPPETVTAVARCA